MKIGNLKGLAARVLSDVREIVNPFGIRDSAGRPFTAIVLRANHDDWANFLAKEQMDDPNTKRRRKANVKAALSQFQGGRGFRRVKADKLIDTLAEDLVTTEFNPDSAKDRLGRKKAGAAAILWRGGFGLDDENGKPLDLSIEENRLHVLSYNADPETGELLAVPHQYLLDGEGKTLLDEDGDPLENQYQNMLLGDAILAWLEDGAEETERFYVEASEQVLGNSAPSPVGSPANGTDSTQSDAQP